MDAPEKNKGGRPSISVGDLIIALVLAGYFNRSSRKATAILNCPGDLFARGKSPAAITLRYMMRSEMLTEWLYEALRIVIVCVREVEKTFAIDSTYFRTPNYSLHVARRGTDAVVIEKVKNAKAHIAAGTETFMIVGVDVSDEHEADTTFFRPLLDQFKSIFLVKNVLADAGYVHDDNVTAVKEVGGEAYFDLKTNTSTTGSSNLAAMARRRNADADAWQDMYGFRSLVETTNSMLKRNLKRIIRARLENSRKNEILLMCLAHNLCRLMIARIEYGIDIPWANFETIELLDSFKRADDDLAA